MRRFTARSWFAGRGVAVIPALLLAFVAACAEDERSSRSSADAGERDATVADAEASVPSEVGAEAAPLLDGAPDAHGDAALDGSAEDASPLAPLLSDTGLYLQGTQTLAPGIRPFTPRFELWADGATKRRFVYLPPGSQIDTTDVDAWRFPVGTKLWKEFSRDGVRVETRLIEKVAEGSSGWTPMAFSWNAEQTRAVAVPEGAPDALGTPHDVPGQSACFGCHGGPGDFVLGFSAIQLGRSAGTDGGPAGDTGSGVLEAGSGDAGPANVLDLAVLQREGRLSLPLPASSYAVPGGPGAAAALGVLHASCAHCHRPGTLAWERAKMDLSLRVSELGSLEATAAYRTAVGVAPERIIDGADSRIAPGAPARSALYVRMTSRDALLAMPPIATEVVDTEGAAALAAFITSL